MIKNKKGSAGNTLQQIMFYAGELLAGIFVIIAAINLINAASQNAEAELIAGDVKYTLESLSTYPYTSYLSYAAGLTGTSVNINQDEVSVRTTRGNADTPLKIPGGRRVEEANFFNAQEIPMILMEGVIRFGDEQIKKIGCEKEFKFNPPKKFSIIYEYETVDERNKLDQVRIGINQLYKPDGENRAISGIEILDRETEDSLNIIIKINPETSNTIIKYDSEQEGHKTFACYAQQLLRQEFQTFTRLQEVEERNTNITIYLPNEIYLKEFVENEEYEEDRENLRITTTTGLMQEYSKIIFNEIILNMVNYE